MAERKSERTPKWKRGLDWGIPAALVGLALGFVAGELTRLAGNEFTNAPIFAAFLLGVGAWSLKAFLIEGSGDLAERIYMGSDQGTSPEYSVARGHEIRGQYQLALEAYAEGADEYPDDPEPLLAGARILIDPLGRYNDALDWLHRAREIPEIKPREEILIEREIIELYAGPMEQPTKALPLLARMAERHAGTRPGEWASRQLAALRTEVWEDVRDDELDNYTDYQKFVTGRGDRGDGTTDDAAS